MSINDRITEWHQKNFPDAVPMEQLGLCMEELGEVSRILTKRAQNIRSGETTQEHLRNELGDLGIAFITLCQICGEDSREVVALRFANDVEPRDWTEERKRCET